MQRFLLSLLLSLLVLLIGPSIRLEAQVAGPPPNCAVATLAVYEANGPCTLAGSDLVFSGFTFTASTTPGSVSNLDTDIMVTPNPIGLGGGFTFSGFLAASVGTGQTAKYGIGYTYTIHGDPPTGSGASIGMDPPFGNVAIREAICADCSFNSDHPGQSLMVDDTNPPQSWQASILLHPVVTGFATIQNTITLGPSTCANASCAGFDSLTTNYLVLENGNLISVLGPAGHYSILGVAGAGQGTPQVHIQSPINYTPGPVTGINPVTGSLYSPATIGAGVNVQLHVDGGNILLNNPVVYDRSATIKLDGGSGFTSAPVQAASGTFLTIQNSAFLASATFAALPATQTFNQQIQNTTTITGNGGPNVIAIKNQINLSNGQNLVIQGCPNDSFIFNIAQGQDFQLNNNSGVILRGYGTCAAVLPSQVVFNFLGNSSHVQIQNGSNSNGIFLDLAGQIQIQGGTHNSVFISGNQIQIQQSQNVNPTVNPIAQPGLSLSCPAGAGEVGVSYSSSLVAIGGTAPYTYSWNLSSMSGLALNSLNGSISGNPTTLPLSFTASAVDALSNTATASCTISRAPCLLSQLGTSFSILGISGTGQNNPQIQIQNSVPGPVSIGVGSGVQLRLTGNASLGTNVSLDEDPGSTIKLDGGSSNAATVTRAAITSNAIALSAQFAALPPTQTFSQIQNTTTITGNGGQNAILITGQISLNNGQKLIISGGLSDTFIFNFASQGQQFQLNNGSSIVLQGVTASQVVFNFGNGNVQLQNSGTSAGIFLDPYGQIQIQGGTHNSVFISGNQIQIQNSPTFTPVSCN